MAAVWAALVLGSGIAWASASSSVTASGPRKVKAGSEVKLRFSGYAATGVSRLRVWLDDERCASQASSEGTRAGLVFKSFHVQGKFRAVLTVQHSAAGSHYACAYLIDQSSQQTAGRASWRYVTS